MAKRVLIVDDDADVRTFVTTVVETHGYTPVVAMDGEEAMAKVKENKPDLIILDVLMPRESGIRMYRELRTNEALKGIPVVILSGIAKRTFLRSQAALAEFGGQPIPEPDAYLEKPAEPEELAATISKVLT